MALVSSAMIIFISNYHYTHFGGFEKYGTPKSSHFSWIFPYKPSSYGVPPFNV